MGGGFRFAGASTMTLEKINFRQQRWGRSRRCRIDLLFWSEYIDMRDSKIRVFPLATVTRLQYGNHVGSIFFSFF